MFKPIWKTIFKPIWKTIYNPEYGEEQPAKINSLISWTFADDMLQTLYSKDRITASDEPARFTGSFCGRLSNTKSLYVKDSIAGKSALTLFGWFNVTTTPADQCQLIGRSYGSYCSIFYGFDKKIWFDLTTSAGRAVVTKSAPLSDGWHFIAGTYDGAKINLYVDGVAVVSNLAHTGTISTSDPLTIGRLMNASDAQAPVYGIDGDFMCVGEYQRALSLAEIQACYNGTFPDDYSHFSYFFGSLDSVWKEKNGYIEWGSQDVIHHNLTKGFYKSQIHLKEATDYYGSEFTVLAQNKFRVKTKNQLGGWFAFVCLDRLLTSFAVNDEVFIKYKVTVISGNYTSINTVVKNGFMMTSSDISDAGTYADLDNSCYRKITTSDNGVVMLTFTSSNECVIEVQVETYNAKGNTYYTNFYSPIHYDVTTAQFKKNILFLGDSISDKISGVSNVFTVQAANYYGKHGYGLYNTAVAGSYISDAVAAFSANKARYSTSKYCVCFIGANDVSGADSAATIFGKLESLWNAIKAEGYTLIAFTLTPRTGIYETKVLAINTLIKASSIPDVVLDAYAVINADRATLLHPDNLHITMAGQDALFAMLKNHLGTISEFYTAGKWHNGAETKIVVGTNGIKDANGWQAVSTVKDKLGNVVSVSTADPNNIFINTTTGYCIEKDVSSMPSISTGDYVFLDNSVTNKYRNLLWYRADQLPLFYDAQKAYDFVNGSGAVEDEEGRVIFDELGKIIYS